MRPAQARGGGGGEVIKGYKGTVGGNGFVILNVVMDEYLQRSNFITLYSLYVYYMAIMPQ